MKVVVLVSGGMDSVAALYDAAQAHEVVAGLSFDYGSKHNHCEIPFAAEHCEALGIEHRIVSLGFMDELFKSDLLKSGGDIPEGHYEAENMKQDVFLILKEFLLFATGSCCRLRLVMPKALKRRDL